MTSPTRAGARRRTNGATDPTRMPPPVDADLVDDAAEAALLAGQGGRAREGAASRAETHAPQADRASDARRAHRPS